MTIPPTDGPPDDITTKVPDVAQTYLAFRVWRFDRARNAILSLNAPVLRKGMMVTPSALGIARAMATDPLHGWPPDELLKAVCDRNLDPVRDPPPHKEPDTCGIYATTEPEIVHQYLGPEAPILGVVELGGLVVPATQGFRAQLARLAAVLLIDTVHTVRHSQLRSLADRYHVPTLVPIGWDPEEYRPLLVPGPVTLADEVEGYLRGLS